MFFLKVILVQLNLMIFFDSLALSLNNNIRSDGIYFDFAKAFDSVNHDLILMTIEVIFVSW